MIKWLRSLFKVTRPCKACDEGELYWNSICGKCGYYQHSCMTPEMYNYLKSEGHVEKLYSKLADEESAKNVTKL